MGVFGKEDRELSGPQAQWRRDGGRGKEGEVFLAVVGLRLGEAGERRPEQRFPARLDELDINVVPVRLEFSLGDRLRRVGLHEREAIVASDGVASDWQVGGQAVEECKCRAESR